MCLRDLLGDQERTVLERSGSRQLVARDAVCGRVVEYAGQVVMAGMHPRPLPPFEAAAVVDFVRQLERRGECDLARLTGEDPWEVLAAWDDRATEIDRRPPPVLHNTDGDKLQLTIDHFALVPGARVELEDRLADLRRAEREGEPDEGATAFVLLRDGNKLHGDWENTVVGRVLVSDTALRIESNSTKRANSLRTRIERVCGDLIRRESRERKDMAGLMAAAAADGAEDEEIATEAPSAAMEEIVRETLRRHYAAWLDQSIPALGGKTPRQAARGKKSRVALDVLLRDLENHEARRPAAERFDVAPLRAELGMDEPGVPPDKRSDARATNERTSVGRAAQVFRIKVTLDGTEPAIWRRLEVGTDTSLAELHDILQVAMGWEDCHLHEFEIRGERYGVPSRDDFGPPVRDERRARLGDLVRSRGKLTYLYDFGDSWRHTIIVEKQVVPEADVGYPRCTAGARACPPEDCGGIWGYQDLLAALASPSDPGHDEVLDRVGDGFDVDAFDPAGVTAALQRRRARRAAPEPSPRAVLH
jgi:hypothetical protein